MAKLVLLWRKPSFKIVWNPIYIQLVCYQQDLSEWVSAGVLNTESVYYQNTFDDYYMIECCFLNDRSIGPGAPKFFALLAGKH